MINASCWCDLFGNYIEKKIYVQPAIEPYTYEYRLIMIAKKNYNMDTSVNFKSNNYVYVLPSFLKQGVYDSILSYLNNK